MTTTEEIIAKDFEVVRKGYDPDQVKAFLREAAETVARLEADLTRVQGELSAARELADAPAPEPATSRTEPDDDFSRLGTRVAAVLQSAEQHAAEITDEARADAQQLRSDADDYDRSVRGEADDYSRSARADADAYAELVGMEAENRARARVETILAEASEARRTASATRDEVAERLRTAAEDLRLTFEAFDAGPDAGTDKDPSADVDAVFAEVREAASVFTTSNGTDTPESSNGHLATAGSTPTPESSDTTPAHDDLWS